MRDHKPFYRDPKFQTLLVAILALILYIYLLRKTGEWITYLDLLKSVFYTLLMRFGRIPGNVRLLVFDVLLCLGGVFLWMAFFSQFILPLRTLRDRYDALDRLVVYVVGEHGPAVFIENGKTKEYRLESKKRGPGLVILDTASAAVLRNDFAFTRTTGPGVVFTSKMEYLAKAVDLHARAVKLGPLANENPYLPWDENADEPKEVWEKRQERRLETSALTRDGVEVVPNIQVVYRLKRRPGEKSYSFGYNPTSVLQWVTADGPEATAATDGRWDSIPLHELPAYMAVEVWREYLQKYTLQELFTSPIGELERGETAYATITGMVNARLTRPMIEEMDRMGKKTGREVPSREFITLGERGIQVLGAGVLELRFEPWVESRLVQQWVATWMQRAQAEHSLIERKRSYEASKGRKTALELFTWAAIREMDPEILSLPRPRADMERSAQMRAALERLLQGTLDESIQNPQLVHLLQSEENNLRDLLAWVREQT